MAKVRAATNHRVEELTDGWQICELPGGTSLAGPSELGESRAWSSASCPGTVASARRAEGAWDWASPRNFDAVEWWYRARFKSTPCAAHEALWLELAGLSTLADVWLNGVHVLRSENMFLAHELDVSSVVSEQNEICIRFASLETALTARRPRPRFKTRLVDRQQLRWFRTTLLGRIPGWTPPVTAVGPWRSVRLVRRRALSLIQAELRSEVTGGRARVVARFDMASLGASIDAASLRVGSTSAPLAVTAHDGAATLSAELALPEAELWWPNGYGAQPRYPVQLSVSAGGERHDYDFDALAFRTIAIDRTGGGFALSVNGVEIRCRGACWAPVDVVSLADDGLTVATVEQARDAYMNMLRVGGTMIYESDAFYDACDRNGILVWQDFMFANCDYPGEDQAFCASVSREAEQFLSRTETRASLAVLCGNSEVEQQVAMLGLPRETWQGPLFDRVLRGIARAKRGDVPYLSSTPTGGALPFQPNTGLTHYYGVGAYQRPLEDARRADVRFTPECLGFANIPEQSTIDGLLGDGRSPFHDPRWKARVPRDSGPGWDFDDVRDFYTRLLFGVDPLQLRYEDPQRALALGRVTSGEVMARTLAEWRRPASNCRGALIWLLRDLWPGAGWGLIDAHGLPKAAYYFVKRALQPEAIFLADEGLNGLTVHVLNDREVALEAELELQLFRSGAARIAAGKTRVEVAARAALSFEAATLFDYFIDFCHAYRFGPPQFDVACATLTDARSGALLSSASYFPGRLPTQRMDAWKLEATLELMNDDEWRLSLSSERFAHAVAVDVPDFSASDSYFDLVPGSKRTLRLRALRPGLTPRGEVWPLNARAATRITVLTPGPPR